MRLGGSDSTELAEVLALPRLYGRIYRAVRRRLIQIAHNKLRSMVWRLS
jgi:hypothetical protein